MLKCTKLGIGVVALLISIGSTAVMASPQPLEHRGGVDVDVFSDMVRFAVRDEKVSFLRVEIFDQERNRIFDSGLSESLTLDWDLTMDSGNPPIVPLRGNLADPGFYFYVVHAWDVDGDPLRSRAGKVAVAPAEMADAELRSLAAQSDALATTLKFDAAPNWTVMNRLGVGTENPERAVHLQGRNAVFRMDRDVDSAAFLLARTAANDFDTIWQAYVLGVNADGPGDGSLIINDLGGAVGGGGTRRVTIDNQGQFGINTSSPDAALDVAGSAGSDLLVLRTSGGAAFRVENDGDVFADGSYNCGLAQGCFNAGQGADVAERIDTLDDLEPGDVVEIDPDHPARFHKASAALSRRVAGVVSTAPAITLGNDYDAADERWRDDRPLLALAGRVPVKVTAEPGAIAVGDLLVSSPIPGYAMRCVRAAECIGAVVGKALEPLAEGQGKISAQVMLR